MVSDIAGVDTAPRRSVAMAMNHEARTRAADGTRGRIQRALKLSALFERASRATREAAAGAAEMEVVPGGTLVIEQGAVPVALLLLGRGRARVERVAADGRVVPLGYRGSGDVL